MARDMVYNFHVTDNRMEMRSFESGCYGIEEFYGERGNRWYQKSA